MSFVKTPPPRQLSQQETLDSLDHWKNLFRNFYRRDSSFKQFLARGSSWNFSQLHYGLQAENEQEPEERAEDLTDFLNNLAGFLPNSYLTKKILEDTTCLQDCWNLIYEHYNVLVSPITFLDFEAIKKEPAENYRQLYERLLQHVRLHLAPVGAKAENLVNSKDDTLTVSLMNLVAVQWLRKCDPSLIEIVKAEYSTELRNGEQIAALVPRIAQNIDSLLARHSNASVNAITETSQLAQVQQVQQWGTQLKPKDRTKARNMGKFSALFCPGCFALNKELKAQINFKHRPSSCPRSQAVARFLQASSLSEEENEQEEASDDSEADGNGEPCSVKIINTQHLQNKKKTSKVIASKTTQCGNPLSDTTTFIKEKILCNDNALSAATVKRDALAVSDTSASNFALISRLTSRSHLWSTNEYRKEQSPRVKAFFGTTPIQPVIDEGSEVNCLSESFIKVNHIDFVPANCNVSSADCSSMGILGQTKFNIVISLLHASSVVWDLGKCLVVRNLSVDMLVGEPGKMDNCITTIPHLKKINTRNVNGDTVLLDYATSRTTKRHLCKIESRTILYSNDSMKYSVPTHLEEEDFVALSPIKETPSSWIRPAILKVDNGQIEIHNMSPSPVMIEKNTPFADLMQVTEMNLSDEPKIQKIIQQSSDRSHYLRPKILDNDTDYTSQVSIDPDNQLAPCWRLSFRELCSKFSDVLNPNPGRYNGHYGDIDNSIDFLSTPPPSVKARLPNYPTEKLQLMATLMDKLETMGVLAKPEDVGVVPTFVVPSLLMPKPEKGEWRLVSDFTPLNLHIRKFQTISPTIQDAKKVLAKYKFNIECDLSHYFFQGGMRKEDMQYLATPHPYKGLRVYCVEPQGLRNASEHAYERLSRIFGDLCMSEKMTRMADGLYIVGDTVQDLLTNFEQVLIRARNAGLTFKPKKVIIAPKDTVLFGWKKSGEGWRPTEHIISPLIKANEPSTVKQLRSFIGSYKQLTECIKDYAVLLSPLEKATAGRNSSDRVTWTPELRDSFIKAKNSLDNVETIFVAKPSDRLEVYTDYSTSAQAVGGRLVITRIDEKGTKLQLLGGHFSCKLNQHQQNWLPCEGEALGVKLVCKHFGPTIMENANLTTLYTDNLPTVHAWKRMKTGAFSTSARVASFLTGISALNIEIKHKPGKTLLVSDYNSRHPNSCSESNCKICQFAFDLQKIGNKATPMICSISIDEIENGTAKMPFTQRAAWAKVQAEDKVHKMLFKLIETSGMPEKKKTKGDYTRLKRLHNLFRNGQLKVENDGLCTVSHTDPAGNETRAISVPYNFFPGLIQSLHIKMKHPSKAQMIRLVSRYFYCSGHTRIINEITANCDLCKALKDLPKELFSESTTPNPVFGKNFSADIIKKDCQLIFICREKLSQFTCSRFIPDETADSIRDAIVATVLEFMPEEGATVQVDCAPGLQTLAAEAKIDGSILKKLGILIELGRTLNTNKNPIAENCIKEFHKERLRLNIPSGRLSEINRAIITKNMNSRIRDRGYTPKEMAFNRDQISNKLKPMSDEDLSNEQVKLRENRHPTTEAITLPINIGEDVYLKKDKSKLKARDPYKVTKLFTRNNEKWAVIQKNSSKFMAKQYEVKIAEIFPVTKHKGNDNNETLPPVKKVRKYRKHNPDNIVQATTTDRVNFITTSQRMLHAWRYEDWIKLCDMEEDEIITSKPPSQQSRQQSSTMEQAQHSPPRLPNDNMIKTPNLNSVLRFNIQQLRHQTESSHCLLQRFPPSEEPEPLWDHSPEFLTEDGHITWNESLDMEEGLSQALKQKQLFSSPEKTESLTSMSSDDSSFFNSSHKIQRSKTFLRSDLKRKPLQHAFSSRRSTPKTTNAENTSEPRHLSPVAPHVNLLDAEEDIKTDDARGRPLRRSRRQVNYQQLHNYGWQSLDEMETEKEKKKKPRS